MFTVIEGQIQIIDVNALALDAAAGAALVVGQRGFIGLAYDGTNLQYVRCTTGGQLLTSSADVVSTGALGALNASVSVTTAGSTTAGFQLAAGTLIGTIVPEVSYDNGTTWNATYFDTAAGGKVSSIVFASANTATAATIVGVGGSGMSRVRVSLYTSGTANITVRATTIFDPSSLHGGPPNTTSQPPTASQIAGWDGTNLRVPAVIAGNTQPTTAQQPLLVMLSPNQQPIPTSNSPVNASTGVNYGDITVAATTLNAVRRTAYTEQAANFTGSVVSSSASDSAAGVGARQLQIYRVDVTGATSGVETVTLNGTTAVNLTITTKCFIERMQVISVGTSAANVGVITLKTGAAGAGTTVGTINAGDIETFWAHHYVTTGKTCNVTALSVASTTTVAGGGCACVCKSKPIGGTFPEVQVADTLTLYGQSDMLIRQYLSPEQVNGPARLVLYVAPNSATSAVYKASIDYYDE